MKFPLRIVPAQTRMTQELKHAAPLIGCRFDPSGRFVFAGGQDNAVQRWELSSGKKTTLVGHESWIRALAFSGKDQLLLSGDYHGRLLIWPAQADAPKPVRTIDAHAGWLRAVSVSRTGQLCATCGNDGLIKLWSIPDGKPVRTLSGHGCHVYNVAFSPNGTVLASCDLKGVVKLWDVAKGALLRDLDASLLYKYDPQFRADIGGGRALAFSADGQRLACAGITDVSNAFAGVGKPLVVLFDVAKGQPQHILKPKEAFQGTAWGVVFHPAGFVIGVGGGNGGVLWFWHVDKAENTFSLKLPNNARDLDLHHDGKRLAVPYFDGAVRIYDMSPKT